MVRQVARMSILWIVKTEANQEHANKEQTIHVARDVQRPSLLLVHLVNAAAENRPFLGDTIFNTLCELIYDGDEMHAVLAAEMAYSLPLGVYKGNGYERSGMRIDRDVFDFWREIGKGIIVKCGERILRLAKTYFSICIYCFDLELVTLREIVEWYEFQILWEERLDYFHSFSSVPLIYRILFDIFRNQEMSEQREDDLNFLAYYFENEPTPWIYHRHIRFSPVIWQLFEPETDSSEVDDKNFLFTAIPSPKTKQLSAEADRFKTQKPLKVAIQAKAR
jgi:hypothetical protein